MKEKINITIPKSWQELSDKQLRYVFRLLNGSFTLTQIKTLCLLHWSGMKVLRKEGAVFIIRYRKKLYPISALQITESLQFLNWLGDFPQYPVRLSRIGFHRPVGADLQNVAFEDFLTLDNLYQGYLQTQNAQLLQDMAGILYKSRFSKLSPEESISIFYWYTSLKRYFASLFKHFFTYAQEGESTSLSFAQLQENMNTQIRALTGGDITKESDVLRMDCWRALTELDAKAKDYEELQKQIKK